MNQLIAFNKLFQTSAEYADRRDRMTSHCIIHVCAPAA